MIWSPAEAIPAALKEWAEGDGKALLQRGLQDGEAAHWDATLLGAAAIWKEPGKHTATPWHQDCGYRTVEERRDGPRHGTVWLALTAAGPDQGGMVVCPAMGPEYREHVKVEIAGGFRTRLAAKPAEVARSVATDVLLEPGDVLLIDDRLVHRSHPPSKTRIAFSPLYELRAPGLPSSCN